MPSPCPSPTPTTTSSSKAEEDSGGNPGRGLNGVSNLPSQIGNPVLYDMDSQSTEVGREIKGEVSRGTKRRRNSSDSLDEDDDDGASKKRRESTETSPDTSRDESGYQSDSSQHEVSVLLNQLHSMFVKISLFFNKSSKSFSLSLVNFVNFMKFLPKM